LEPAYDKHDEAVLAAQKKDLNTARKLAREAVQMQPQVGRLHQLLGDIELADKNTQAALPYYQKAIDLNSDYFGSYLGAGVAQYQSGDKAQAEQSLKKSFELLPTAPAAYFLGNIAKERGDAAEAFEYYKAAAGSNNRYGKLAASELVRMDLPRNPGNYVATSGQVDASGRLMLIVENRAPVPLSSIQVTPVLVDGSGRIVREGSTVVIREVLNPNQRIAGDAGVGAVPREQLAHVRFRVDGAKIAQ